LQSCEEKFGIQRKFKGFAIAISIFGESQTSIHIKEKEKLAT